VRAASSSESKVLSLRTGAFAEPEVDSWTDKLPLAARPPSLAGTIGGTGYRATWDPPSADRNGLVKLDHLPR
jgi:hypothetical protein